MQDGANDIGDDKSDQEEGDKLPQEDQRGRADRRIQEHLRSDQWFALNDSWTPDAFMFLGVSRETSQLT